MTLVQGHWSGKYDIDLCHVYVSGHLLCMYQCVCPCMCVLACVSMYVHPSI